MARIERHSEDFPIQQPPEIDISDLDENLDNRTPEIILADAELLKDRAKRDYLDELVFNQEFIQIYLYRGREEYAPDAVSVSVQGRSISIPVEQEVMIRRMYAEVLIRAKPEKVRTNVISPPEGSESTVVHNTIKRDRSSAYAFTVTKDNNPRGHLWIEGLRREA